MDWRAPGIAMAHCGGRRFDVGVFTIRRVKCRDLAGFSDQSRTIGYTRSPLSAERSGDVLLRCSIPHSLGLIICGRRPLLIGLCSIQSCAICPRLHGCPEVRKPRRFCSLRSKRFAGSRRNRVRDLKPSVAYEVGSSILCGARFNADANKNLGH